MRPAAEVSKLAYGFDAIISFHKGEKVAHAHSVVEMLMLGAFHGDELEVVAIGNDAEVALEAIASLLANESPRDNDIDSCAA
jgi:phosphotransferase system HPr (HPr) family protein